MASWTVGDAQSRTSQRLACSIKRWPIVNPRRPDPQLHEIQPRHALNTDGVMANNHSDHC